MKISKKLYDLFIERAQGVKIDFISIGLGYTAVTLQNGGVGLSYTYFNQKTSCQDISDCGQFEGKGSDRLLEKILSNHTIDRSVAVALINALNHEDAVLLPEDPNNKILFQKSGIQEGVKIAMVGYFRPLIDRLDREKIDLQIFDLSRGIGNRDQFYDKLKSWADILFLTSTSILNNTMEDILKRTGENVMTVMLGPSTPMIPQAFDHLPVHMLAGMVPINKAEILKAIRHGMGTPVLKKYSRKSYILLD